MLISISFFPEIIFYSPFEIGFSYSTEENLADAVVDIRLIDQQKQNVELSETVERLTSELNKLQNAANDLYAELSQKTHRPDAENVLPEMGKFVREMIRENAENVARLVGKETELKDLLKLNEQLERDAKETAAKLMEKGEEMSRERHTHKEQMASLQSKIHETEESLAAKKAELKHLNVLNEERKAELEQMKKLLEVSVSERDNLQLKLTQLESEMKETTEILQTKSTEVLAVLEAKESLQSQLNEVNAKIAEIEKTLQTTSDRVETLSKQKADLADRLKDAEQLIVALNGEIIENQSETTQQKQLIEHKKSTIDHSEKLIAQLTDEKCELEKDNLSLAHARAKAEEKINELSDQVTAQSNALEQQRKESAHQLEICAKERDDLKTKLSAAESELATTAETLNVNSEEISKLKQDIVLMGEKHAINIREQQSKQDEALAEAQSLRTKIDELQSEIIASTKLHADSCTEMDILAKEKSDLEEKVKSAEATINTLNNELSVERGVTESEQAKLRERIAENERLEKTIEQLTNEKNELENEILRLHQLKFEAEEQIAALDLKVAELHAEKEDLGKTIEMNANEYSALNTKVQLLTQASVEAEQRFVSELEMADERIKELNDVSILIVFLNCSSKLKIIFSSNFSRLSNN